MILLNLSKEEDFSILKTTLSSEFAKDALPSPNLKNKIKLAYAIMNDTNILLVLVDLYSTIFFMIYI